MVFSENLTCILVSLSQDKRKMIYFLMGFVLNKHVPCHLKSMIYRLKHLCCTKMFISNGMLGYILTLSMNRSSCGSLDNAVMKIIF